MLYHPGMSVRLLPLLSALLLGCACSPTPGPEDVPGTEYCQAAEDTLESLQCLNPDGTPMWVNADGELFHVTCERVQDEGGIFLDPQCIAEATLCEEAEACPTTP